MKDQFPSMSGFRAAFLAAALPAAALPANANLLVNGGFDTVGRAAIP
jgi:hypothetical protein